MKLDFKTGYIEACRFIAFNEQIKTFPYDIRNAIDELTDIKCRKYSTAKKYGIDINAFGSEDAYISRYNSKTIIFYNDKLGYKRRDCSITHDFGHIIYKHPLLTKEELLRIDPKIYGKYEKEAFFFYAQAKMPDQILRYFENMGFNVDFKFIMKYFGVTEDSAKKRVSFLESNVYEWRRNDEKQFDEIILRKFSSFIDCVVYDYKKNEKCAGNT